MQKRYLDTSAVEKEMLANGIDSIAALAGELDLERSYVSRVINAQRPVQASTVLRLCALFGCRPHSLICNDEMDAEITAEADEESAA